MKTFLMGRFIVSCGIVVASLIGHANSASSADLSPAVGAAIVNLAGGTMASLQQRESVSIILGQRQLYGWSIGDGQCTRLVEFCLGAVGATPGRNYVWGRPLNRGEAMRAGDIIQFTNVVIQDGSAKWTLGLPNHTAIVGSVNGSRVTVFHQNVDGQPAIIKSRIRVQQFDLGKKVSGSYIVYRPQK